MRSMIFFLALLLATWVSCPALCLAEMPVPVLKGIRVFPAGESFGVEITTDKDLVYTCTKIPPLRKIIVDLPNTEPGRPDTEYKIDSALIADIRFARIFINDVLITRILINLKEDADYSASLDPSNRKSLTVMLHKVAAAAAPAVVSPGSTNLPQSGVSRPEVKPLNTEPPSPVTVSAVSFTADAIDIHTNSQVAEFKAFTLPEPGRLVIDIPAARSSIKAITVPANGFGIVSARIGKFEGKLRLVFTTGRQPFPGYSVEKQSTGLRVRLRKGAMEKPSSESAELRE
ncbi:MAG: AMIN domain-containing protein [Geobacteraceae bacterium]|nr:AMIN domain-containing protein [Geobacteraceae bacterium]